MMNDEAESLASMATENPYLDTDFSRLIFLKFCLILDGEWSGG